MVYADDILEKLEIYCYDTNEGTIEVARELKLIKAIEHPEWR